MFGFTIEACNVTNNRNLFAALIAVVELRNTL
eukprot:SAG31_NODE_36318_length_314_cov_0.962791_1_plen_31_part_10